MNENTAKRLNQSGMVSFMVTLIMMAVITLIVIGFSQVTRRNEREALDRQLSSQAFYAAESGVNVTKSTIAQYVNATSGGATSLATKTACTNGSTATDYSASAAGGQGSGISALSATSNVRYTCVLVNPNPDNVVYSASTTGSVVAPLFGSGNFGSLTFKWNKQPKLTPAQDSNCAPAGSTADTLPPADSWKCGYGVVRVDLMAVPTGGSLDSDTLNSRTVTLFLSPFGPHDGTATVADYTSQKAFLASASGCDGGSCQVKVKLPGDSSKYYARITSLYRDAPITITGASPSDTGLTFIGSQAIVDVTGQAQDELRRVQVRIALTGTANSSDIPLDALASSSDICKHFSILSTDTIDPSSVCE